MTDKITKNQNRRRQEDTFIGFIRTYWPIIVATSLILITIGKREFSMDNSQVIIRENRQRIEQLEKIVSSIETTLKHLSNSIDDLHQDTKYILKRVRSDEK